MTETSDKATWQNLSNEFETVCHCGNVDGDDTALGVAVGLGLWCFVRWAVDAAPCSHGPPDPCWICGADWTPGR